MQCETCGRVAAVHFTEVKGGMPRERHLCDPCSAGAVGMVLEKAVTTARPAVVGGHFETQLREMLSAKVRLYRAMAGFMRLERRGPTEEEARELAGERLVNAMPSDQGRWERYAAVYEWMARLTEVEGRAPWPWEILDWADRNRG